MYLGISTVAVEVGQQWPKEGGPMGTNPNALEGAKPFLVCDNV